MIILIIFATILCTIINSFRMKIYAFNLLNLVVFTISLVVFGIVGALILGFAETGIFGAVSNFGALYSVPILILPISKILKTDIKKALDFVSIGGPLFTAVLKINCYVSGCCFGRVIGEDTYGNLIRFPSQLVECGVCILILVFLLIIENKEKFKNLLFPIYFITYGTLRFILHFFREYDPLFWNISLSHVWALLAVIIGILWIIIIKKKQNTQEI